LVRLWDAATKRGLTDGATIAIILAVLAFLTNVVFPGGPNSSDGDPLNVAAILAGYMLIAAALIAVGFRGARRIDHLSGGVKAGASAGLVVVLGVFVTFLVIDNVFFDVVSRQLDKQVAFAHSGSTSMRAFINTQLLVGGSFMVVVGLIAGGILGLLGATISTPRRGAVH
jgi:hypothetical protein